MYQYILIVDDHAGVRQLLFEVFSGEGYNVEMAATGAEALLKVRDRVPSLILLDEKMPGMTGLETLAKLRRLDSNLSVVIITAYGELDTLKAARNSGLVQHQLSKPFDLDEVRHLVRHILSDRQRLEQELKAHIKTL